jgi:ribonuclease T2
MRVSWSRNLAALVAALAAAVFGYQQIAAGPAEHVLAVSWQPAFCETRPRLPECRSQTADRFDASNFALHGLWPQPRSQAYCGVDERTVAQDKRRRWRDLPWERLDDDLWSRLRQAMPGTRSGLHKHEWIKHGTCYDGAGAAEYFEDSLKLLDALNRSGSSRPVCRQYRPRAERRRDTCCLRPQFRGRGGRAGAHIVQE